MSPLVSRLIISTNSLYLILNIFFPIFTLWMFFCSTLYLTPWYCQPFVLTASAWNISVYCMCISTHNLTQEIMVTKRKERRPALLFSLFLNHCVWISVYWIEVNSGCVYLAPGLIPSVSVLLLNCNAGGTMGGTAWWQECLQDTQRRWLLTVCVCVCVPVFVILSGPPVIMRTKTLVLICQNFVDPRMTWMICI